MFKREMSFPLYIIFFFFLPIAIVAFVIHVLIPEARLSEARLSEAITIGIAVGFGIGVVMVKYVY